MAVTAITGDIGAGKSTAAKILAQKLSCPLLDADLITAELWRDEKVKEIFISRWGKKILDPSGENIIKSEVSRLIFNDINEYKFCNSVLHPLVMRDIAVKVKHNSSCNTLVTRDTNVTEQNKNIVIEIPLIFEAGRPDFVDKVIYIAAGFDTRAQRCQAQRGWSIDELKRREGFLLPREKKILLSDFVIYNDGNLEELERRIYSASI